MILKRIRKSLALAICPELSSQTHTVEHSPAQRSGTDVILKLANLYSDRTGLTLSTIASYAVNDGKRFDRIKNGGGLTLKTFNRLIDWFDANFPEDLEWPPSIPRPSTVDPKNGRAA